MYGLFADYADQVPLLASIRPSGEGRVEDLEAAGGARAVMKRPKLLLDLHARTVSGETVADILRTTTVEDGSVARTMEEPWSRQPSIIIVRGSLIPGGGIVRLGGGKNRATRFRGPATVFQSREEALEAIREERVTPGQVLVLRGLGVQGGPGMAFTPAVVFALDGLGLLEDVAVITEGQVSGLVNRGLVVGEASPEAVAGGPLGLVEDGDAIEIDVDRRTVDLSGAGRRTRSAARAAAAIRSAPERGWLGMYRRLVQPVHRGAVLDLQA